MKWYFETCKLSHVLLLGIVIWAVSATILLWEIAPLVYIGLHLITTGVFFLAFLKIAGGSRKAHPPADA